MTHYSHIKLFNQMKNYKEWDYTLILIALVFLIALLSSCYTPRICDSVRNKMSGYDYKPFNFKKR